MILGFDFGMKYIGVASGQTITHTATPLTCLQAKDGIPNWDEVGKLISEWQPEALVVGSPLNMDGTPQYLTQCANKFAQRLRHKYQLPVHLVDERLSTWEAKQSLRQEYKNPKPQQLLEINAHAAAILLTQWLQNEARD